MKLVKSLLLGTASGLLVVAGASAADLPSRKAAPVSYVKVCDAYGAGFFYIPGTETCVKVGGRVRADYAFSAAQSIYGATTTTANVVATAKNAVANYGVEARARVDLDARTQTAWGTVQTVVSLRLARTSGILSEVGPALSPNAAVATLEAAYVRFAGFTFGVAKDNFSFMPSTFYGAGHWGSFANGAKQLAYTAVLGGGFSATIALQDTNDTILTPVNVSGAGVAPTYSYNNMPQVNANIAFDQAWGSAMLSGALGKAVGVNPLATYDADKLIYAVGAGLKVNLPMIAAGDVLWLNAAYAEGMTEYTTNWTSFKSSDVKRNVGGYVTNMPSYFYGPNGIETPKSWVVAGLFSHYWTPTVRHSFLASYGQVNGTTTSKSINYGSTGAFGNATVWNVGTQLAWFPVSNFEIGVEALYARVEQDVRRTSTLVTKEKAGNFTGRMRVERTF
ncbi:MAG: hypothetical protein JWM36_927 [Hyphomicrobiales bacterium]|nr:hypothetical protein [Hyphomicrobiales bacterium]